MQTNFSLNENFPLTAYPFVALPNGTIVEGLPLIATTPTVINFAPIAISPPVFGIYQVGINFVPVNLDFIAAAILGTVTASLDLSVSFLQVPVLLAILPGQGQMSVAYVYDVLNPIFRRLSCARIYFFKRWAKGL